MAKKPVKKKTKKSTNTAKSRKAAPVAGKTVPAQTATAKSSPILTPMPQAGRKVTEFEAKLDAAWPEGMGDETKRGRGRPRKETEPEPAQIDIKVIGQTVQIPFDLWSVSQGIEGLKITDQESILIAKPAKQLIDHYLPQVPEIGWAWISLSVVSYSIMKSRLVLIAEIKKANSSDSETRTDNATRGPGSPVGHGGPNPSASFPTIKEIVNPVT